MYIICPRLRFKVGGESGERCSESYYHVQRSRDKEPYAFLPHPSGRRTPTSLPLSPKRGTLGIYFTFIAGGGQDTKVYTPCTSRLYFGYISIRADRVYWPAGRRSKSQSYFNESPLDHYYIGTYSPTYISSLQSISLSSLSREMGQLIDMYTRVGVVSAPPAVGHSCSCLHTLHTSCHHKEARYNKWSQFCWRKRMIVLTIANNV